MSTETLRRGQPVVLRTERGTELGEVLLGPGDEKSGPSREDIDRDQPQVLRTAGPDDLDSHHRSLALRDERFSICRRILQEAGGTADLLDVEPLLDPSTTVLHVLGPADLDLAVLRARLRSCLEFDVLLEPVGGDQDRDHNAGSPHSAHPTRCGDCDCGGGECSRAARQKKTTTVEENEEVPAVACATSSHDGCASCGVTRWLAAKRHSDA
jgi:hypothetical protein